MGLSVYLCVCACVLGLAVSKPKPQTRGGRVVYLDQHLYPSLLYINMASGTTKVDPASGTDGNSDIIQLFLAPASQGPPEPRHAVVVLGHGTAEGTLTLTQQEPPVGETRIEGTIKGLTPGLHGFHIHQKGSLKDGCVSAAGHYNPYKQTHGSPDKINRHVGDLGNIFANETGVAQVNISDPLVTLVGPRSVVGRAIVVHAGEDDLGEGGDEGSLSTGNAGGRVACGVIGHA